MSVENSRKQKVTGEPREFDEDGTSKTWCQMNLEKILQRKEKWITVDDLETSPGCQPGENFVAEIHRVVAYGRRLCLGVWTDFRKNFIIKRIPNRNSSSHSFHDCFRLFENEIAAYENILPLCQHYLDEKSQNEINEFCFPKYYGQCQTFLVLQDLQTEGYQMVNRVKGFSKKECSAILQELSRFHAISFALKKREKESFSKMRDRLKEAIFREEYVDGIMGAIWENSLVFAVRSLNESKDPRLKKASEKLECYSGRVLTTLISLSKSTLSKFDVLCHGDLWNNNILLRYCDAGYPISVKFIDLQAMRYGSCVLDVMHVLFTSSRPVIYEKHFHPLLSEYYDSLVKNLRNLGESPDFTFDEFKAEFKWRIFFGILVACLMLTCVTRTSPAKSIDAESTAKKLANDSEVEKIYESLKPGYHERLRSLFLTLTDFDLI